MLKNCYLDFAFNTRCLWYNHISVLYLAPGNTWISNFVLHILQCSAKIILFQIVASSPSNIFCCKGPTSLIESPFKTMKFEIYHERQGKNGFHSWIWDHSLSVLSILINFFHFCPDILKQYSQKTKIKAISLCYFSSTQRNFIKTDTKSKVVKYAFFSPLSWLLSN